MPSQDTYRAELAKLAGDDPAPWLAALIAPEPPVEPGPPPEPAWLGKQLARFYGGGDGLPGLDGIKVGWHSHMAGYHADVDAWDRAIARWYDEAKWELIGSRQWPLPGMVAA